LQALELRLVGKSVSLDRSAVASALTVFRTLTRDLKDATDSLRAATATVADAPAASSAAADLQADLNALGQSFAGALARFDERLDGFAADQADQLVALETRMAGRALALDRTEVASALTVFRDLSRELSDAVGRFGAATGLVEGQAAGKGPQETAAQFGDIAGRLDALASAQGDRLDSLELRLAARDASIDRTAVAGALTAFRALGQSLQEATSRFETATAAVEAKARELLPAPDLAPLAGEIAEIGGRLDAFAASQAEAVAALAARLDGEGGRHYVAVRESEAEAVDALRGELRAVGDQVAQTLGAFAARLDLPPAPRAAESEPPALRDEFDRLGGRLAETLADLERRLTMAGVGRPAAELAAPSATKSPGALAKIVVSLADSLDFRFSQIEQSLAELSTKWQVGDPRRETATTLAEITAVLTQVNSASEVLKTGLSDFIGVSAALMEDVDARHRPQRQEERRDAS
jgi:hypothetical protein